MIEFLIIIALMCLAGLATCKSKIISRASYGILMAFGFVTAGITFIIVGGLVVLAIVAFVQG